MAYKSTYDPDREADLSKQSARGKSIARRGRDIKDFRKSLPFTGDPKHPFTYQQKEYTYSPRWREKGPGDDAKEGYIRGSGLIDDASTMWGDVTDLPVLREGKTMVKDLLIDPAKKYLPNVWGALQMGLGSFGQNRIQNAENEEILGDAYSDEVRKEMMSPSDREFYEKYMHLASITSDNEKAEEYRETARTALENAQITRRVNYALGDQPFGYDTSADAGVAAFGADKPVVDYRTLSGRLQSGLEGTKGGREFLSDVIPKGEALMDTGMIGNAAARIARAQAEGRAGFFEPWMNEEFVSASPDELSIADIQIQPKPFAPGYGEEWDIDTSPYRLPISRQESLDTTPEEQELLMAAYTDPIHGNPYYREGHIPTIDERAGTGYTDYRGVNPFRNPYLPMENAPEVPSDMEYWTGESIGPAGMDLYPSPMPPVPMPAPLRGDTDWYTPPPPESELRGWDWIDEPVMEEFGVDRPSIERERKWPNTPFPGYQDPPPWYSRAWDWLKEGDWPRH